MFAYSVTWWSRKEVYVPDHLAWSNYARRSIVTCG